MSTFIYSPGVQILIATEEHGVLDVSEDLTSGSVSLNQGDLHNLSFSLLNLQRKYDHVFTPNDRVIVRLKRVAWVQVMAGYLTTVPYYSIYSRTVSLTAECTLKKLKYKLYDAGADETVNLLGEGVTFTTGGDIKIGQSTAPDSNLAKKLTDVLVKIGQWPAEKIHLGQIPPDWWTKVSHLYDKVSKSAAYDPNLLQVHASIGGTAVGGASVGSFTQSGDPNGDGALVAAMVMKVWSPDTWRWAVAVSHRESTWNPTVYGDDRQFAGDNSLGPDNRPRSGAVMGGGFGPSIGLFQIRTGTADTGTGSPYDAKLLKDNPTAQVEAAWKIYQARGQQPWGGAPLAQEHFAAADLALAAAKKATPTTKGGTKSSPTTSDSFFNNVAKTSTGAAGAAAAGKSASAQNKATAIVSKVLQVAQAQLGIPYSWGGGDGTGPTYGIGTGAHTLGFDCSGFALYCYAQAGLNLTGHFTGTQFDATKAATVSRADVKAGDLLFFGTYPYHHVGIAVSNTQMIDAPSTGNVVRIENFDSWGDFAVATRPTEALAPGSGSSSATLGSGGVGSQAMTNAYQFLGGTSPDPTSEMLTGPRLLMNDAPLLPLVQELVGTTMRTFCSAPNGDFIAWFPDYFNAYGQLAVMVVEPIELLDFTLNWSDQNLVTHQFVIGSPPLTQGYNDPTAAEANASDPEMFRTDGIASIDFPDLLRYVFNLDKSQTPKFLDPSFILNKHGARADTQTLSQLVGRHAEFFYAVSLFQRNWSQQFAATLSISFMPELFPGMILQIPGAPGGGIQFYVSAVTHSWSMQNGGGFQTRVTVMAPANLGSGGGHLALPSGTAGEDFVLS